MDSFEAALRLDSRNEDAVVWMDILRRSEGFTRKKLKPKPQRAVASTSAEEELQDDADDDETTTTTTRRRRR